MNFATRLKVWGGLEMDKKEIEKRKLRAEQRVAESTAALEQYRLNSQDEMFDWQAREDAEDSTASEQLYFDGDDYKPVDVEVVELDELAAIFDQLKCCQKALGKLISAVRDNFSDTMIDYADLLTDENDPDAIAYIVYSNGRRPRKFKYSRKSRFEISYLKEDDET